MQLFTYKTLRTVSLFLIIATFISCKEIFEQDLSMQNITVVIPQNNTITSIRNVHFKWNELEDATSYTLEIVSPSFSNIMYFDIDSTFSNNEININLVPGDYQWRVRANNSATKTDFTLPYNLKIDTTSNLTSQTVILNSPTIGFISDKTNLNFIWSSMNFADDYDFVLKEGNDFNSGTIISSDYNTLANSSLVNNLQEKEYVWGVRAKNNLPSLTNYSTRVLFIDTTHPIEPTLISPAHNSLVADTATVLFSWSNSTDPGGSFKSNVTSVIEISTDSAFSSISKTINSNSTSENYIFNSVGTYYWRMYTKDDANNESLFNSPIRKITTF